MHNLFIVLVFFILVVPGMAQQGLVWVQKVPGGGLGSPLGYNPQNHNTVFGAPGNNQIWRSTDRGRNWYLFSTVTGGNQIKSIHVHPEDTLMMIVGQEAGPPDRIMKTTDGGLTWVSTWRGEFSFYGVPVAYEVVHPNLVYTMGWDSLFRSTDFGSTWTFVRTTLDAGGPGVGFDRWDCGVIRPDSANILYVGDITNGLWKSTDSGLTWTRKHFHTGEYPVIAIDRFNPMIAYSALWSGIRGFLKTTDGGETWFTLPGLVGRNTWGAAVSIESPGYVYTGTYGDPLAGIGGIYFSRNYGETWTETDSGLTNGSNYGMMVTDTLSVFALQANGIWKLRFLGNISGMVFKDLNVNGTYDEGEPLMRNRKIRLSGPIMDSMLTDLYGRYQFTRLLPGNYTVSIDTSDRWAVTMPPTGFYSLAIVDGDNYLNKNFGIIEKSLFVETPNGGEVWEVGSLQNITWIATLVPGNVKIELSRDGGLIYQTVFPSTPNDGSEPWTVTFPPTTQALIRISSVDNPSIFDISDSVFTIASEFYFHARLVLSDNGGLSDTLFFGTAPEATDGVDSVFGEIELPPKPGVDTFDVRWKIPETFGTKVDIRDTLGTDKPICIYLAQLQPGPSGYPFTVRWNPDELTVGDFFLRDEITEGINFNINMRRTNSYVITDASINSVQVVYYYAKTYPMPVNKRWNIISIPLNVQDSLKSSLFPTAISEAYMYRGTYLRQDTLKNGIGYWLKFSKDEFVPIVGREVFIDTVTVFEGWNIIGSISYPVPTSTIVQLPPDIVTSSYFGYKGGYFPTDILLPGLGYWVKVSKDGKLILKVSTSMLK